LVAGPRNHFYRTPIWFPGDALRAAGEVHHVRDLADELDREAVLGSLDLDALDETAQDLKRLSLCRAICECRLQVGDLLPVNLREIGMEAWRWRRRAINLVLELDDPSRHWKISEGDYSERELWPEYVKAYEDVMALTSTTHAPWQIIPANHKWFRNLAVSQIIADTMDEMGLKLPPSHVDIAEIRRKYHAAERQERDREKRQKNDANTKTK